MQNFTTNAINLKSYNLSETDKIIVMYSKDKGIIRAEEWICLLQTS